ETEIVEYDDWMIARNRKKDAIEEAIAFQIDFKNWEKKLTRTEKNILQLLLAGYNALKLSELLKLSYITVKENIKRIQQAYQKYFCCEVLATP
ncbi:MAG: hypothetical protein ACM34N_12655, partial [Ignavibacteria bacterium]